MKVTPTIWPDVEWLVVRNFRDGRGWTQRQAADWFGCSERSWRRYENSERPVPQPLLNRIKAATPTRRRKP